MKNLKVGDRVGVPWLHSACGSCEYCRSGWETLCKKQLNTGFSIDGGLREYSTANADYAIKLPPTLSFEQAARMSYIPSYNIPLWIFFKMKYLYSNNVRGGDFVQRNQRDRYQAR